MDQYLHSFSNRVSRKINKKIFAWCATLSYTTLCVSRIICRRKAKNVSFWFICCLFLKCSIMFLLALMLFFFDLFSFLLFFILILWIHHMCIWASNFKKCICERSQGNTKTIYAMQIILIFELIVMRCYVFSTENITNIQINFLLNFSPFLYQMDELFPVAIERIHCLIWKSIWMRWGSSLAKMLIHLTWAKDNNKLLSFS